MPKIRTFSSTRDETRTVRDQSGAVIGEAIAGLGEQVGVVADAVGRMEDRRDTSRLTKEATETQTQLLKDWQETVRNADENDKELASRWMEEKFTPAMENLGSEGSVTRKAQAHLDQLKVGMQAHFDRTTFKDSSDLVGVAAQNNFQSMVNELSTQAMLDYENPDAYLAMLSVAEDGFIAAGGSRAVALKLREDAEASIAKGAINGYIEDEPELAKAELDAGNFGDLLSGPEQKQLSRYADSLMKSRAADQKRLNGDNASLAVSNSLEGMLQGASMEVLLKDLSQNPVFDTPEGSGPQRIAFNVLQSEIARRAAAGSKTRPNNIGLYSEMMTKLATLDPGDPDRPTSTDILLSSTNGVGLSYVNALLDAERESQTGEGKIFLDATNLAMTGAKEILVGKEFSGIRNPAGIIAYNQYVLAAQQVIRDERNKGLSNEEIFGTKGTITAMLPKYIVPLGEGIESFGARLISGELDLSAVPVTSGAEADAAVQKQPEETPEQFLKRTK